METRASILFAVLCAVLLASGTEVPGQTEVEGTTWAGPVDNTYVFEANGKFTHFCRIKDGHDRHGRWRLAGSYVEADGEFRTDVKHHTHYQFTLGTDSGTVTTSHWVIGSETRFPKRTYHIRLVSRQRPSPTNPTAVGPYSRNDWTFLKFFNPLSYEIQVWGEYKGVPFGVSVSSQNSSEVNLGYRTIITDNWSWQWKPAQERQ